MGFGRREVVRKHTATVWKQTTIHPRGTAVRVRERSMAKKTTSPQKQEHRQPDNDVVRWYALTHPDVDSLLRNIQQTNEAHQQAHSGPVYDDYFIPYEFLRERVPAADSDSDSKGGLSDDDIKENRRIRNTLRRFVFIKATGHNIRQLLSEEWNRQSPYKLQPYAATVDHMKYVPDRMMDAFMSACYDQREKFELTPFVEDAGIGAEVVIREGQFKSAKARVKQINHRSDGLHLTLSVELFARNLDITLYDYRADKVTLVGEATRFITNSYTDYVQQLLLDILSRRVNHKETPDSHRADLQTLSHIWRYQPTEVTDRHQQAQVTALLLICARLRYDEVGQKKLLPKAQQQLAQLENLPATRKNCLSKAILHISLYLATGNPAHRSQSKEFVFHHTPESHPLRRFISLIRR